VPAYEVVSVAMINFVEFYIRTSRMKLLRIPRWLHHAGSH